MDKKHLRLLGRISPELPVRDTSTMVQEKVEFAAASLKCLKVIAWPVPRSTIKPVPAFQAPPPPKLPAKSQAEELTAKAKQQKTAELEKLSKAEKPKSENPSKPVKPSKPPSGWIFISELVLD